MKTIEYYMPLPYRLEILPDPDERLCGTLSGSSQMYYNRKFYGDLYRKS